MIVLISTPDSVLVAIPMVALLFVGIFRLDELFGQPRKLRDQRRAISGLDEAGRQICLDPDGKIDSSRRKRT